MTRRTQFALVFLATILVLFAGAALILRGQRSMGAFAKGGILSHA